MMKRAVIVGGSRGIGLAIAQKFMQHEIDVTLVSRTKTRLQSSSESLNRFAAQNGLRTVANYAQCDLTNDVEIVNCCQQLLLTENERKSFNILVNSAGVTYNKLLLASSREAIHEVIQTNLLGTILFTKMIAKQMVKQKEGVIINIASIVGSKGNIGQSIYAASKAGIFGFSKSLAKELGTKGIRVNVIAPGFIETDMTEQSFDATQKAQLVQRIPLGRMGSAEEVANVAYFLVNSSYVTGQVFNVDGGLSLAF